MLTACAFGLGEAAYRELARDRQWIGIAGWLLFSFVPFASLAVRLCMHAVTDDAHRR